MHFLFKSTSHAYQKFVRLFQLGDVLEVLTEWAADSRCPDAHSHSGRGRIRLCALTAGAGFARSMPSATRVAVSTGLFGLPRARALRPYPRICTRWSRARICCKIIPADALTSRQRRVCQSRRLASVRECVRCCAKTDRVSEGASILSPGKSRARLLQVGESLVRAETQVIRARESSMHAGYGAAGRPRLSLISRFSPTTRPRAHSPSRGSRALTSSVHASRTSRARCRARCCTAERRESRETPTGLAHVEYTCGGRHSPKARSMAAT
ncbi:hypothetical protein FB451DRAFT_1430495 [Mycena latifolia]|nr:hypothetical protein FB451DRAFT_1430495 [Mycena latifolia]